MHFFDDLVYRSTAFTLSALEDINSKAIEELQTSASTIAIKNLQMIQLQKAIIAIGIFSLFESILQQGLDCRNGFDEAKKIITQAGNIELINRFENFICAINVLKHGKGKSYNSLVAKSIPLPFRIRLTEDDFIEEGDVSDVSTLIEVNDNFVLDCAEIIGLVSEEIRKVRPDYYL